MRVLLAAALLAALTGCSLASHAAYPPTMATSSPAAPPARHTLPKGPFLGVYVTGVPSSYAPVTSFARAADARPNLVIVFSGWKEPFRSTFVQTAYQHGTTTIVQMNPAGVSLQSIVAGKSDTYLRSYARSVASFGHPVIMSFGHEMNGSWYQWGAGHVKPATFVAAWRHVVQVFRSQGADNAVWMWTVNSMNATRSPLSQWWPGASWVDWVGIDGYYYFSTDSFETVFGTTISALRRFTKAPVLLSETAVGISSEREDQITGMFQAVRDDHLLGLVWFDQARHDPPYHQDWRLEDDPEALRTFGADARKYL